MAYKVKVTAGRSADTQWLTKPDGSPVRRSNGETLIYVVDSNYKDRVFSDDLLKQTGLRWNGAGRPMTIMNANGWTVEPI